MHLKNHLLLARALAKQAPVLSAHPLRKEAFVIGNLLPDFVPFTYLDGFRSTRRMVGHNLPYSQPKIARKLKKGLSVGLHSASDAFRLGVLTHYLADSFTYPHTTDFQGSYKDHSAYERRLKAEFPKHLSQIAEAEPATSPDFLRDAKQQYDSIHPSPARDAEWIVRVCTAVFLAVISI